MSFIDPDSYIKMGLGMTYEEFNAFLDDFMKNCVEETLKVLPGVVGHLVRSTATMQDLSKNFYEDNKDLVDHKDSVSKIMEQVEHSHPGMKLADILKETGSKTREMLKKKGAFNLNPTTRPAVVDMDKGFGEL